uniref:Uncharacterized protein n=1 Tax=Vespula pensylvanica TaxID=30213 RepID=A0A834UF94_VESPE|nr:hypothetical protein H0235_004055 [Vespula pensylvanica]
MIPIVRRSEFEILAFVERIRASDSFGRKERRKEVRSTTWADGIKVKSSSSSSSNSNSSSNRRRRRRRRRNNGGHE